MHTNAGLNDILEGAGFSYVNLTDANVWIHSSFLRESKAAEILNALIDKCPWQQPKIKMGKKTVYSPRLASWHGDADAIYTYSGLTNLPCPWDEPLSEVRELLFNEIGIRFNSVLVNYYRNGRDSMGWHRDNEPELGQNPVIVSVSLGGPRKFLMRHARDKASRWVAMLEHGSALVMSGETQTNWRHCIPKSAVHNEPRINLTFRQIVQ